MEPSSLVQEAPSNQLLAALPPSAAARLEPQLTPVTLRTGQVLAQPDEPLQAVYFPTSTAVTVRLATVLPDVAPTCVGREGLVGLPLLWGQTQSPQQISVQLPGTALHLPATAFQRAVRREPALRTLLGRYVHVRMLQLELAAVCNAVHPLLARLARWLLQLADQCGSATLPLTHDQLARMLGVRRAGVTVTAQSLQQAGIIRYARGRMTIVDRARLAAVACPCYGEIARAFAAVTLPSPEQHRDAATAAD